MTTSAAFPQSPLAQPAWRESLAGLRYLAAKVARVHGPTHPDVATLSAVVDTLADSAANDTEAHAALSRRMAELTGTFRPWPGACGSVYQLYAGLKDVVEAVGAAPEKSQS